MPVIISVSVWDCLTGESDLVASWSSSDMPTINSQHILANALYHNLCAGDHATDHVPFISYRSTPDESR